MHQADVMHGTSCVQRKLLEYCSNDILLLVGKHACSQGGSIVATPANKHDPARRVLVRSEVTARLAEMTLGARSLTL